MNNKFEIEFKNWLDNALKDGLPTYVGGIAFNLFEPAFIKNVKFGIELIGATLYDPDNEDWACDEIWEPKVRQLMIPQKYSTHKWQDCQELMKKLLIKTINTNESISNTLNSVEGIGFGFVDGNLEIIEIH